MTALHKLTATGIPNIRYRKLGNGDIAYYYREGGSFALAGTDAEGMTPQRAARIMRGEVIQGTTLRSVFARFDKLLSGDEKPTKNMLDYKARYLKYIDSEFGTRTLESITSSEVGQLYHRIKRNHSESLAYHVCNVIRYLYNRAIEWGMYQGRLPMGKGTSFVLPMPQRQREEIYTEDEVRAILAKLAMKSKTVYDMVIVAYTTGMRLGEICNLRMCHVNLRTSQIKIVDPKGKRDTYVSMPDTVAKILSERMTTVPDEYVFKGRTGGKIKYLSKTFKRVLEEVGINEGVSDSRFKKSFHSLRHTFATEVLASGLVGIGDLKNMLGHKNITTTQRYVHPSQKAMTAAASMMNGKLAGL